MDLGWTGQEACAPPDLQEPVNPFILSFLQQPTQTPSLFISIPTTPMLTTATDSDYRCARCISKGLLCHFVPGTTAHIKNSCDACGSSSQRCICKSKEGVRVGGAVVLGLS